MKHPTVSALASRQIWFVLPLMALVAIGYLAWRAQQGRPKQRLSLSPNLHIRLRQLSVMGRTQGEKGWELEADTVEVSRDDRFTTLRRVRRGLLYHQNRPALRLSAGSIRLDSLTKDLEIADGLQVRSTEGLRIEAQHARWFADQRRLICSAPITIKLGQLRISAPWVEYQADQGALACPRGVQAASDRSFLSAQRLVVQTATEELSLAGGLRGRFDLEGTQRLLTDQALAERIAARVRSLLRAASARRSG